MNIYILNENACGKKYRSEHGLSYLIESDIKILLDSGHSNLFLENASKLGVNLSDVDYIVLSHGHWDHADGLVHLDKIPLVAHPEIFRKRFRMIDDQYIGMKLNRNEMEERFPLHLTSKAFALSDRVWFLGEIPRVNDFESKQAMYYHSDGETDWVPDDTALCVRTEKGLVVISGCSHSGICNIVDYAIKVSGITKIHAIIGGFHLKKVDEVCYKTIDYIASLKPEYVMPSHCTSFDVIAEFRKHFGNSQLKSGDLIELA